MNQIEQIRAELLSLFPGITAEVDPPALDPGNWHLDLWREAGHLISVEYRPGLGFGISTPKPDDLWGRPDEVYEDPAEALARLAHLIENGSETSPPTAVRSGEIE